MPISSLEMPLRKCPRTARCGVVAAGLWSLPLSSTLHTVLRNRGAGPHHKAAQPKHRHEIHHPRYSTTPLDPQEAGACRRSQYRARVAWGCGWLTYPTRHQPHVRLRGSEDRLRHLMLRRKLRTSCRIGQGEPALGVTRQLCRHTCARGAGCCKIASYRTQAGPRCAVCQRGVLEEGTRLDGDCISSHRAVNG